MTARGPLRGAVALSAFVCFCAGVGVGWWLHAGPPLPARTFDTRATEAAGTGGVRPIDTATTPSDIDAPAGVVPTIGPADEPTDTLRDRNLRVPIDGLRLDSIRGSFAERRGGGRAHEAADMLAPRNTPVHAVDDGRIVKLFLSKAGGITIYQFDPSERFCYYYAHLERYADGLTEGAVVSRGDVIGYVGTSGNAPPTTPHLHFAIFQLTPERHWWQGTPIDPYRIFDD